MKTILSIVLLFAPLLMAETVQLSYDVVSNPVLLEEYLRNPKITWNTEFGVNDKGVDVKFYSETSGDYSMWDQSLDSLIFVGSNIWMDDDSDIVIGTDLDWKFECDTAKTLELIPLTTDESSAVNIGADAAGADLKLFPAATGDYLLFDASANELLSVDVDIQLDDAADLIFGTDNDFVVESDVTKTLEILPGAATDDYTVNLGVDQSGVDLKLFGATTGESLLWDASGDDLIGTFDSTLFTMTGAAANQFKVDATGTIAGYGIVFETTDGGVQINADGAANGDISVDAADDLTLTAGGDLALAVTGNVTGNAAFTGTLTLAGVNQGVVIVTDAAEYDVLAANSGKTHIILDLTQGTSIDLPTEAAGLHYKFVYCGGVAEAHNHTIDSENNTNFFKGGVAFADTDAGDAADEIHTGIYSNGSSNSILTLNVLAAGTVVDVYCDGTNWYVTGVVYSATAPAFSDQS